MHTIVEELGKLASREFGSVEPTVFQRVVPQFVGTSGWFRTPEWLEWNALSLFAKELGTTPPPEPLDRALETLFGEHAELVRRLLEGDSIEQLARERQVAPSHIKARLRRALHRLDGRG